MKREIELIKLYADDVLKACVYYLENRSDAEKAFTETFEIAMKRNIFFNERDLRINLFKIVREVCGALYFPDENEEWLYYNYFKLTTEETLDILGEMKTPKFAVKYSS